jgi:16S rRNA (guanine966-N2)-methyltransferase
MRVIGGTFGSRTLQAPPGMATRPSSDRLRETLFNVLAPRIEGARFLDLYAGSGAVGIEALSRGAAEVVFVERAAPALKVLRANLARLGLHESVRTVAGSVAGFLRSAEEGAGFNVVFLDPPYDAAGDRRAFPQRQARGSIRRATAHSAAPAGGCRAKLLCGDNRGW